MFVNYAHRGASAYAPENTICAFDLGLAMGANGIETDLQLTKDGQIVLFHDDLMDEKSNATGAIRDYTYEELLGLDFGGWMDPKFAGTKIVLFEDFARRYLHLDITFALELKVPGIEAQALEIMKKYGNMDRIFVSSFLFEALEAMHRIDPTVKLTWLTMDPITPENVEKLKSIGGTQICPWADQLTAEGVKLAKANGLAVRICGVTDTEIMRQVYPLDTEGMTVNFPDELARLMAEQPR